MEPSSRQTIAHEYMRGFSLLGCGFQVGIPSPYFHTIDTRKKATSRNIRFIPKTMNLKALITGYSISGAQPNVSLFFESDDSSIEAGVTLPISIAYSDNDVAIQAKIATVINNFCSTNSLPAPTIDWLVTTPTDLAAALAAIPTGLSNAPQAAIADAPADAVTNYNTVTTLLGAVTGAVNTANSKQNDIATKLNSLLTELRTLGLISP